jgi:hypothetical protein
VTGFRVQVEALRSAATAIDDVAAEVGDIVSVATAGAAPAAASNPGFYLSEVLGMVTDQIAVALRGASQDLNGYAGNLNSNADAYDEADRTNADTFNPPLDA